MADCLFCKISLGEIPAKMVYQDPELFAFQDIAPQAPTHLLVCPRKHIASLEDASEEDTALLGRALLLAKHLAGQSQLGGNYRVVLNSGRSAGQSVFHVHFHLMGGREFHWPPG